MIEEILKLDSQLFLFLNNLGSSTFDAFWIFLSYKESNIFFYLSLLIFYFYKKSKTIKEKGKKNQIN